MKVPKAAPITSFIALDWIASNGRVNYEQNYTLLFNKPKLSFEFIILHYVTNDETYPNGYKTTSESEGLPIELTPQEIQEIRTYCQNHAVKTWTDLCSGGDGCPI